MNYKAHQLSAMLHISGMESLKTVLDLKAK